MAICRTGIATAVSIFILFGSSAASGDEFVSRHIVATEPICTITDEAKCWSPTEVENALSLILCGNGDQPCNQPKLLHVGLHAEEGEVVQKAAVVRVRLAEQEQEPLPAEPKLDASGVPEFNAWEEGCD